MGILGGNKLATKRGAVSLGAFYLIVAFSGSHQKDKKNYLRLLNLKPREKCEKYEWKSVHVTLKTYHHIFALFSQTVSVSQLCLTDFLYGNVQGCVFDKNRPVSLNWSDYMRLQVTRRF